jgi:hypothetical protein
MEVDAALVEKGGLFIEMIFTGP